MLLCAEQMQYSYRIQCGPSSVLQNLIKQFCTMSCVKLDPQIILLYSKNFPFIRKLTKLIKKKSFLFRKSRCFSTCLPTFLNCVYSLAVYARLPILPYRYLLCQHPPIQIFAQYQNCCLEGQSKHFGLNFEHLRVSVPSQDCYCKLKRNLITMQIYIFFVK